MRAAVSWHIPRWSISPPSQLWRWVSWPGRAPGETTQTLLHLNQEMEWSNEVWIQWFLPFGFSLFQPIVLVLWLATLPFCFSPLSKLKNPTDCLTVCPEPNSRWMCRWTQRSVLKRRSQIFLSRAKRRFARVREAWKSIFAGLKSFNHKSNITCVTPHSLYSELEQQLLCFMNWTQARLEELRQMTRHNTSYSPEHWWPYEASAWWSGAVLC